MALCVAILISSILIHCAFGEDGLKRLSTEATLSTTHQFSVSIKINEANDAIELDLLGPSDVYYAIGFGSNVMVNTWSIVVNGEGDTGWFEQTLSNHRAGLQRATKSFAMLENTFSAHSYQRRLHLKTSLTSLRPYHPFDIDDDQIDVIWAIGSDENFVQHIEYGTKTLYYKVEGMDDEPSAPHDVWIYFGDMNLSAIIVVVGMVLLMLVLFCYWSWKFCKYLRERAERQESDDCDEHNALLRNYVSVDSNNRYIVL